MTTTPTNIPLPAGATSVGEWCRETGTGDEFRTFESTHRDVECRFGVVNIDIDGEQFADDGRTEYHLSLQHDNEYIPLDPDDVGPLTAALLAAQAEVMALTDPGRQGLLRLQELADGYERLLAEAKECRRALSGPQADRIELPA